VQRELQWLYADARVASCVGGMDPRAERRALDQGCHIVVGTPGRLRDHLERGQLRLGGLAAVVLDEADEMLDLGFKEELEEILDASPKTRRTLLFSATLPRPIVALASAYQNDALRLVVGSKEEPHGDIDYRAIRVAPSEIELAAVNVLRFFDSGAAIVFCSTREAVRKLHASLVERGFNAVALSGELTQNERSNALQSLRDGRARVCVATDVAARGIDIPDLDLVIHADLPNNKDTLQHRSGRTGRAGRKGVCVILVPHHRRRRLELLLNSARIDVTWQSPPTADDIRAQDQARLVAEVAPAAEASEEDQAAARDLMANRSAEDIAAAYIRLARARMPAPEDLSDSGPEPQPYGRDRGGQERGGYEGGGERRPEAPRAGFEDAVWFRLDFGRNRNAEARWLLPMICRRGHVTKGEIGAIRIFERETRFQIVGSMAEQFATVAAKGGGDGGNIERLDDDAPPPPRDRSQSASRHRAMSEGATNERYGQPRERRARDAGPREEKPREESPRPGKPRYEKPRNPRPEDFVGSDEPRPATLQPAKVSSAKPHSAKPYSAKPKSSPFAGPPKAEKPWSPPLDDDGPRPAKPPKAKKSKKRKANG
jgi:ATP-dependent RNA helicase DeaD